MSIRQQVQRELDQLPESELSQVVEYLRYLKYRAKRRRIPVADDSRDAALYAEFADEDRELAEAGIDDYARALAREDQA